jgi:hypothetical protein
MVDAWGDRYVEAGQFELLVGSSSRDQNPPVARFALR